MPRKHSMPAFLDGVVLPEAYERWLGRKAMAHVKRDRKRGHLAVTCALYKEAIHAAVVVSGGRDAYTGEQLDWKLISNYKNEDSKAGRHSYKSGLPYCRLWTTSPLRQLKRAFAFAVGAPMMPRTISRWRLSLICARKYLFTLVTPCVSMANHRVQADRPTFIFSRREFMIRRMESMSHC